MFTTILVLVALVSICVLFAAKDMDAVQSGEVATYLRSEYRMNDAHTDTSLSVLRGL